MNNITIAIRMGTTEDNANANASSGGEDDSTSITEEATTTMTNDDGNANTGNGNDNGDDDDNAPPNAELEARAIAQAMHSADAAYYPSPSLLASDDPTPLLLQVDGPSLGEFNSTIPSVYQGKSVPIALRTRLDVPIHVVAGGSIVEYTISTDLYDIAFGVTAEREEGITNVKELVRVDSHIEPVTGKFLVGSVPCALIFTFSNEYSWFREKRVTYRIVVTPPKVDNVIKGRRLRATKALEIVIADSKELHIQYKESTKRKSELTIEVQQLEDELAELKKALEDVTSEEVWLGKKIVVRREQISSLTYRLENGWEDEKFEV
jgi:hypothetical protein